MAAPGGRGAGRAGGGLSCMQCRGQRRSPLPIQESLNLRVSAACSAEDSRAPVSAATEEPAPSCPCRQVPCTREALKGHLSSPCRRVPCPEEAMAWRSHGMGAAPRAVACWRYATQEATEMLAVCFVLSLSRISNPPTAQAPRREPCTVKDNIYIYVMQRASSSAAATARVSRGPLSTVTVVHTSVPSV